MAASHHHVTWLRLAFPRLLDEAASGRRGGGRRDVDEAAGRRGGGLYAGDEHHRQQQQQQLLDEAAAGGRGGGLCWDVIYAGDEHHHHHQILDEAAAGRRGGGLSCVVYAEDGHHHHHQQRKTLFSVANVVCRALSASASASTYQYISGGGSASASASSTHSTIVSYFVGALLPSSTSSYVLPTTQLWSSAIQPTTCQSISCQTCNIYNALSPIQVWSYYPIQLAYGQIPCSIGCNDNIGYRMRGALGYSVGDYGHKTNGHFDALGMGSPLLATSFGRGYSICNIGFRMRGALGYSVGDYGHNTDGHFDAFGMGSPLLATSFGRGYSICNIGFRMSGAIGYSDGDYGHNTDGHFDAFGMGSPLLAARLGRAYRRSIGVLDSNLRGMGFVPNGPFHRTFLCLIVFGTTSQSVKEVASGVIWVRDSVIELRRYLQKMLVSYFCGMPEFWERIHLSFCRASVVDASGWFPVFVDWDD